ncbi:MAG: hypothetical protein KAH30_06915 [Caldisericia bacterium]|nr:hypothetical protein [Caldisericia bacterium]
MKRFLLKMLVLSICLIFVSCSQSISYKKRYNSQYETYNGRKQIDKTYLIQFGYPRSYVEDNILHIFDDSSHYEDIIVKGTIIDIRFLPLWGVLTITDSKEGDHVLTAYEFFHKSSSSVDYLESYSLTTTADKIMMIDNNKPVRFSTIVCLDSKNNELLFYESAKLIREKEMKNNTAYCTEVSNSNILYMVENTLFQINNEGVQEIVYELDTDCTNSKPYIISKYLIYICNELYSIDQFSNEIIEKIEIDSLKKYHSSAGLALLETSDGFFTLDLDKQEIVNILSSDYNLVAKQFIANSESEDNRIYVFANEENDSTKFKIVRTHSNINYSSRNRYSTINTIDERILDGHLIHAFFQHNHLNLAMDSGYVYKSNTDFR